MTKWRNTWNRYDKRFGAWKLYLCFSKWQKMMVAIIYKTRLGGAWVAQSGQHPTLDFSFSHVGVVRWSPARGSPLSMESGWPFPSAKSPPHPTPHTHTLMFSLSNKILKKKMNIYCCWNVNGINHQAIKQYALKELLKIHSCLSKVHVHESSLWKY